MIFDKIENIDIYKNIPQYAKDFIKTLSLNAAVGRYRLENDDYANIESYNTKTLSEARYEKHNKYIDIQLLLDGEEYIYYKDAKSLSDALYNEEKDIAFYSEIVSGDYIKLDGSNFMMIFPHEAHAPQVCEGSQYKKVLKVVLKIKV